MPAPDSQDARSAAKPPLGECVMTASHTRRACDNGGSCWCIEHPEEVAAINAHPDGISWLGVLDAVGHKLRLPRLIMRPICDLYDIQAGIPKNDLIYMDYTHRGKRTPWWLR